MAMEHQILAKCESDSLLPLHALSLFRSLTINPSTAESTISAVVQTLTASLRPSLPSLHLGATLRLLSEIHYRRPHLSPLIFAAVRSFSLLPNLPPRAAAESLSLLLSLTDHNENLNPEISDITESLFLSLAFRPNVSTRHWLLQNAERCGVRPSLLLTVLLGFTKDPYPLIRRAALDELVALCRYIVVEDRDMIEGCYFRAVELLFDMEDYVRCSAVRAICSMVRDMSVEVRVESFYALGKIRMVSEDILLQTLSKKVLPINKEKRFPGQFTAKQFGIPASAFSGAFIHGLEDEFHEVRRSACCSLRTLTNLSADFAGEALNILMDVLNDDAIAVRLQALETMHHMGKSGLLRVLDVHMHMFLGTLVDSSTLIRSAAREVLRIIKLPNMALFRLFLDRLIENLEIYPQDEADVFSVIFKIGRTHGNFAVSIIQDVSLEIEPSFVGKLGFDSARSAALLVLAISAPLSHEQRICSIPPRIFSNAVVILGRISHGLADIMKQDTLLAYLSHCSRSAVVSASEFFKWEEASFPMVEGDPPDYIGTKLTSPVKMHLQEGSDGASEIHSQGSLEPSNAATPEHYQLEVLDEVKNCMKLIFAKVEDIWALIRFRCMDEVLRTLRSWKEELASFSTVSPKYAGGLAFTLQYLRAVKLLGNAWVHFISKRKCCFHGTGELGLLLGKLDRILRDMRFRFIGLSMHEELHILELILVTYALRLSKIESLYDPFTIQKLHSTISRVELLQEGSSIEPSTFVTELKKSLHEIGTCTDGASYSPFLFQNLLELFTLKQFVFCGELRYVEAELEVRGNDLEQPRPFVPGLPVGIPFSITLYNTSSKSRLWLRMTMEDSTQFVYVDLSQFGGCDEVREFAFDAPFYNTPKIHFFALKVCMAMECLSEELHLHKDHKGPKHEIANLCKEKEVYLSNE
ncbi:hypothetical protein RJ639_037045, partial [Escallonia herrerae]